MCQNAEKTAGNLLATIEPMLVNLLTPSGLLNTPTGEALIAGYNATIKVLEGWTPGTAAQNVLEAITALQGLITAVAALPALAPYADAINVVLGIVRAVIGLVTANSPAPPVAADVAPEVAASVQTFHAHAVAAETSAQVETLTGYKVSTIDKARAALGDTEIAATRAKQTWNKVAVPLGLAEV